MPSKRREERAIANTPIHSGEILADEIDALGLSAVDLEHLLDAPPNRISQSLVGRRAITPTPLCTSDATSVPRPNSGRIFRRITS